VQPPALMTTLVGTKGFPLLWQGARSAALFGWWSGAVSLIGSDMHRVIKILTIIFFAALMVVLNVEFGPQKQLTASQCSVDITRPGYNTNLPW